MCHLQFTLALSLQWMACVCASQFSSAQDGIYALGKAHMRFTPSLRSFPNDALETVPMLV